MLASEHASGWRDVGSKNLDKTEFLNSTFRMTRNKILVSGHSQSERDKLHSGGSSKQGVELQNHRLSAKIHSINRAKYRCGEIVTEQEYNRLVKIIRRGEATIIGISYNGDNRHGKLYDIGKTNMLPVYDPHIQVITTFLPDSSWWRGKLITK